MVPRIPHPWCPDAYPYEVLEGTGITPQSSHAVVLDVSLELQAADKMSPAVRRAWDRVRTPAERLVTDFFLYHPELSLPDEFVRQAWRDFLKQNA